MNSAPHSRPSVATPLSLWRGDLRPPPPSDAVIAAVLAFGDLRDRLVDGSTLIRCSAERAASEDLRLLLREDAPRALEVSVVFSEPVRRRLAPTRRRPQGG